MAIDVKSPYLGASVAGGGAVGGVVLKAIPWLQVMSMTVAIVAGALSAALAGIRIWKELRKPK